MILTLMTRLIISYNNYCLRFFNYSFILYKFITQSMQYIAGIHNSELSDIRIENEP